MLKSVQKSFTITNPNIELTLQLHFIYITIRQGQYWKIAYQKFLDAQNCIKKGSIIIFFFYLRKLSRNRGQIFSNALVINTFLCQILLCSTTNAGLENLPQFSIFLDSFLCKFVRLKISDKDFFEKGQISILANANSFFIKKY